MTATVFIGLPVRNGGAYIREALDSVIGQSYQDWKLFISDNASEDETPTIIKDYANRDSRIKLARQTQNIGPIPNFLHCANACPVSTPYFAWFAHDDLWHPEFLASMVARLTREPSAGFAWSNVYSLDAYGQYQGVSMDYSRFAGGGRLPACRFLLEHETCGKAMLIYSLFRTSLLHSALSAVPVDYVEMNWDNVFNLACLSRGAVTVDKRHLFGKRAPRPCDAPGHFEPWRIRFDRNLGLDIESWEAYFQALRTVVSGSRHERMLKALISWRRNTRHYLVPRRALAASDISIESFR